MLLVPPRLPPERAFPAPGTRLCGMAWDGAALWHSDADTERLYRINPSSGRVTAEIPCPAVRTDLAYDGTYLWQIAGHPKRIVVVDPRGGTVVQEVPLGEASENACGLHVETDRYWIGWEEEAMIEERDRASHRVLATYPALPAVAGLTLRAGVLWFTDFQEALLVAVDRPSGLELARFQLEGRPTGLCWDGTRFWYGDDSGRRICGLRLID